MKKQIYCDQLHEAIEYATAHNTFHLCNIVDSSENVVVFGLGRYFEEAFERQNVKERFHVRWLCDNNPEKWGKTFHGLLCLSPAELKDMTQQGKNPVVLIMLGDGRDVHAQLSQMIGAERCLFYDNVALAERLNEPRSRESFQNQKLRILEAFSLLDEEESQKVFANVLCLRIAPHLARYSYKELMAPGYEYFDTSIYRLRNDEVFVDCGAFTGDTLAIFLKLVNKQFNGIYAFELSAENFMALQHNIAAYGSDIADKIHLYQAGVSDKNMEISYSEDSSADGFSIFCQTSLKKRNAHLVRLDDALANAPRITFLKMDIEGAEMSALAGAKELLARHRPRTAICVYHRTSDMWNVPLFLRSISPHARIYFRQHSDRGHVGTCCYGML